MGIGINIGESYTSSPSLVLLVLDHQQYRLVQIPSQGHLETPYWLGAVRA